MVQTQVGRRALVAALVVLGAVAVAVGGDAPPVQATTT